MINTYGIFWISIGVVLVFESLERVIKSYLQYKFQCKQLENRKENNRE